MQKGLGFVDIKFLNGHCAVIGRGSILEGTQATPTENWWKGKIEDPEVEMYQLVVVEWRSLDGACPFNPISHGGGLI